MGFYYKIPGDFDYATNTAYYTYSYYQPNRDQRRGRNPMPPVFDVPPDPEFRPRPGFEEVRRAKARGPPCEADKRTGNCFADRGLLRGALVT